MPPLENDRRMWRTLEERAQPAAADSGDEFPLPIVAEGVRGAPEIARRTVLQAAGAFAALSALGACFRKPTEEMLPYSRRPEAVRPGIPLHFASSLVTDGTALGVLVESREGRPIKIEGNPDHPESGGATSPWEQAALLDLYDETRLRAAMKQGQAVSIASALAEVAAMGRAHSGAQGEGLALLVEPDASPLHEWMLGRVRERFPRARVVSWRGLPTDEADRAARAVFGERLVAVPRFEEAHAVATFDADILGWMPGRVRASRELARHRVPGAPLTRLYAIECALSITGMYADHRLRLPPSRIPEAVAALAEELGKLLGNERLGSAARIGGAPQPGEDERRFIRALAADLARERPRALVLPGPSLPAWAHALAHAINEALGAPGTSVDYVPSPFPDLPEGAAPLQELVDSVRSQEVTGALVTAWNPAFTAPADIALGDALASIQTAYLAMRADETAARSTLVLPRAHTLESWSDARAVDGTVSFVQPLILPLFDGLQEVQLFAALLGDEHARPYELLRQSWRERRPDADANFDGWVRAGVLAGSAPAPRTARVAWDRLVELARERGATTGPPGAYEISFAPSYTVLDGRFGMNSWLHERPDPITRQSWGNAARMSVAAAKELDVLDGDVLEVGFAGHSIRIPVVREPGHADGAITICVGYGQNQAPNERNVEAPIGVNAYALRTSKALWNARGATVKKTGESQPLAFHHGSTSMHDREIALVRSAREWMGAPHVPEELRSPPETLYDPFTYEQQPYRWGMAIDLSRCTGCTACVIACQAENNVPCVGPKLVRGNRAMHWLRIDRYFIGDEANPRAVTQPMLCQHCEHAPCEYVCPVNATVHSDEGLNEMVYNRCIGTRYCSNNCPYKVRRFNFFDYHRDREMSALDRMYQNPDVTVRARGVMEKCTYCVQRIERARIQTRLRGEPIRDGDVVTACQQACPTEAIIFGNLNDPNARVTKLHQDARAYAVLNDLGTRPRTRYLVRITHPNPELS